MCMLGIGFILGMFYGIWLENNDNKTGGKRNAKRKTRR
jgi:hypothetical protein